MTLSLNSNSLTAKLYFPVLSSETSFTYPCISCSDVSPVLCVNTALFHGCAASLVQREIN